MNIPEQALIAAEGVISHHNGANTTFTTAREALEAAAPLIAAAALREAAEGLDRASTGFRINADEEDAEGAAIEMGDLSIEWLRARADKIQEEAPNA